MRVVAALLGVALALTVSGCFGNEAKGPITSTILVSDEDGNNFSVAVTEGTGSLVGTVLSDEGLGLPGARVTVFGANEGATTNETGGFQVTLIPPGKRLVQVTHEQFRAAEKEIDIESGKAKHLSISMLPAEADPNFRPHVHDLWGGQDTYLFYEGQVEFSSDLTEVPPYMCSMSLVPTYLQAGARCYYHYFQPEGGIIIPPGTSKITIDVSFVPDPLFEQATYQLTVLAPPSFDEETGTWAHHNEWYQLTAGQQTFEYEVADPTIVDYGHALRSEWSFYMYIYSGMQWSEFGPYSALFLTPIDIKITAHKGSVPVDPPHPQYWKDTDAISMPGSDSDSVYCQTTDPSGCKTRFPNPQISRYEERRGCDWPAYGCLALNAGAVVPPGATRIDFDLVSWYAYPQNEIVAELQTPDTFTIGYKTSRTPTADATWNDYTWLQPTGPYTPETPDETNDPYWVTGAHYSIPVNSEDTDPVYSRVSDWVFMIALPGHENADDWSAIQCKSDLCGQAYFKIENVVVYNDNREVDGA